MRFNKNTVFVVGKCKIVHLKHNDIIIRIILEKHKNIFFNIVIMRHLKCDCCYIISFSFYHNHYICMAKEISCVYILLQN